MTRTLFVAPERKEKAYSQIVGIPKPVLQLKDGKVIARFDSICDAARRTNLFPSCISDVCRGKNKKTGGYGWRYAEDTVLSGENKTANDSSTYRVVITHVCNSRTDAEKLVQDVRGNIEGKITYKINKQTKKQ